MPELYDPQGIYRYRAGFNWRAVATVVVFVAILLPGFINAMNPDIDVGNAIWIYAPGLIASFSPPSLFLSLRGWANSRLVDEFFSPRLRTFPPSRSTTF